MSPASACLFALLLIIHAVFGLFKTDLKQSRYIDIRVNYKLGELTAIVRVVHQRHGVLLIHCLCVLGSVRVNRSDCEENYSHECEQENLAALGGLGLMFHALLSCFEALLRAQVFISHIQIF